ncbi:MAG: DMT family transporter [Rhizobiaceae bacterium]|nr:DMT family transporter [Rhizobiaceae bacterium]
MSIAMTTYTGADTIMKFVAAEMNMGQAIFVRGFFGTLLVAVLVWRAGLLSSLPLVFQRYVMLRAVGELGANVTFLLALVHLPLANVAAIYQALPLAVTVAAAYFFREPVGWRRWACIAVGFVGVLIVVRPGSEGFNAYSLLGVACVLFCVLRDVATRKVPESIPTILPTAATTALVMVFGAGMIVPYGGWSPMSWTSTGLLAFGAAIIVVGHLFIIMSTRTGEISVVAPFRYTSLLVAIVLGIAVFGDYPDAIIMLGSAIVVASGLYMLWRESRVSRAKPAAHAATDAPEI